VWGLPRLAGWLERTPVPAATATHTRRPSYTFTPEPSPTATIRPTPTPTPGIGSTWVRLADGMVMVYVPEGNFSMGSDNGRIDERPVHTVYLDAYWIDRTEVTNAMYAQCVQAGACKSPSSTSSNRSHSYYDNGQYADYPVFGVDWNDASAYCKWEGARLPSEAEWEKAARGTDGRTYPWGNSSPTCTLASLPSLGYGTSPCVMNTTAVGSYPDGKSPYGALDMAGSVWEWVNDWYSGTYYSQSPGSNPTGPASGDYRVLRGVSWDNNVENVRSAYRYRVDPTDSDNLFGFRCSRSH